MAENKAETLHRVSATLDGVGSSAAQQSLDQIWRPARLGKQLRGRYTRQTPLMSVSPIFIIITYELKGRSIAFSNAFDSLQHNVKPVADPLIRRNNHHCAAELPKINMVVPRPQISFPISTTPAFTLTHRGTLPTITSKKCQAQREKVTPHRGR